MDYSCQDKLVFDVKDIKGLLNIGRNQAYALVKSGEFPVRVICGIYKIPKEPFLAWVNSECKNKVS